MSDCRLTAGSLLTGSQKAGLSVTAMPSHAVSAKSQTLENKVRHVISYHDMPAIGGQVGDEGLRPISFEALKTGLLYTFQKPSVSKSVSTPTLSGFTAMVAKKWRGLSDAEKSLLIYLINRSPDG